MSTQAMTQIIADYFKTQPVLKAWLFGSFAHGGMLMDLQELSGREVDFVVDGTCYIK